MTFYPVFPLFTFEICVYTAVDGFCGPVARLIIARFDFAVDRSQFTFTRSQFLGINISVDRLEFHICRRELYRRNVTVYSSQFGIISHRHFGRLNIAVDAVCAQVACCHIMQGYIAVDRFDYGALCNLDSVEIHVAVYDIYIQLDERVIVYFQISVYRVHRQRRGTRQYDTHFRRVEIEHREFEKPSFPYRKSAALTFDFVFYFVAFFILYGKAVALFYFYV